MTSRPSPCYPGSDPAPGAAGLEARAEAMRAALVEALVASGELRTPAWRAAFAAVPRHLFVPRYLTQPEYTSVDGADPSRHGEWLEAVYSNRTLITAEVGGVPTSSGTMPGLVAYILENLQVADGHQVLHVGTGTGYTDALLAARLGAANVTTIDITPELTARARDRLAAAGYPGVTAVTGDGVAGWPPRAPYDRIVATAAARRIPLAWLAQTRVGGIVLAPVGAGFARLTVTGAHRAQGRFLGSPAYFMPLRDAAEPAPADADVPAAGEPARRRTDLTAEDAVWDNDFRFHLGLAEPDLAVVGRGPTRTDVTVRTPDGSTARVTPGPPGGSGGDVTQYGPRPLWDRVEEAYRSWVAAGRPDRTRYRLVVEGADQTVHLDTRSGALTWTLPTH